jgi:hypothetical protein
MTQKGLTKGGVIEREVCNAGRAKHWASTHPTSAGTHG